MSGIVTIILAMEVKEDLFWEIAVGLNEREKTVKIQSERCSMQEK